VTTIACDSKSMAGDSAVDDGGTRARCTKIFRVNGDIVGLAGSLGAGLAFIDWYKTRKEEPPSLSDTNIIILKSNGKIELWDESEYPMRFTNKFYAIGSGADAALAAMYCGKTPTEAVKIACKIDTSTGLPVKTLKRK